MSVTDVLPFTRCQLTAVFHSFPSPLSRGWYLLFAEGAPSLCASVRKRVLSSSTACMPRRTGNCSETVNFEAPLFQRGLGTLYLK
jgi:hypothetical protein